MFGLVKILVQYQEATTLRTGHVCVCKWQILFFLWACGSIYKDGNNSGRRFCYCS